MRFLNAGLVVGAAALASACRAPAVPGAAPPSPAAAIAYQCDDGRTVRAAYDGERARVEIDGRSHLLSIGPSGSGARYVGDGLQWWTRGLDQARLSRLSPGEAVAEDPGVGCATHAPAITDKTAEAAAQVARRYFALLAEGRTAEAARLRADGAVPPPVDPDRFYAVIGSPGPPEGAAGSVYVEAPISLFPRQDGGGEAARRGKVVLRRVNDVPGATADQLRWRIERIEVSPGPGG